MYHFTVYKAFYHEKNKGVVVIAPDLGLQTNRTRRRYSSKLHKTGLVAGVIVPFYQPWSPQKARK